jgi:hypothetical protein
MSTEGQAAVIKALLDSETNLRGPGWPGGGGGGHQMRCPNGHIYFIGDCGGAMVQSICIECGATIGGSNHRLAAGNTVDGRLPQ